MKLKQMAVAIALAYASRAGLMMGALALVVEKDAHSKLPEAQKALYAEKDGKYHLEVEGAEDVSGLKSALATERTNAKESARQLKEFQRQWEGLDPVKIREMIEKMGGTEEAQLIKAGKIDEVVALRMEKAAKAHEKALKEAADKVVAAEARAQKFSARVLDDHIRASAMKAGVHAGAIDDALFRARSIFSLNEEGEPVQLKSGEPVYGKDGKTLFHPNEWMESMKEAAPHWFPSGAAGGGATGNKNLGPNAKTMKRSAFDVLAPAAQRQFTVVDKGTVVDG